MLNIEKISNLKLSEKEPAKTDKMKSAKFIN